MTPDPGHHGRLFKTKKDQQQVLEQIERDEDDDEGVTEAENRLNWAERRRDERQALAEALRRAWALKDESTPRSRPAKRSARPKPAANNRQRDGIPSPRTDDRMMI